MNARERVLWRPGMPSQRCECGAHDKNKNGQRSARGVCVCLCVCAMEASAGTLESGVGIDVGLSVVRRRKTLPEAPSRARFLPPQSARVPSLTRPIIQLRFLLCPRNFQKFPRIAPLESIDQIVWLSYPGVGRISGARSSLTQRSRWSRESACVTRSSTMTSEVFAQAVRSYMYVGIWMSISITVILFNKWLLAFAGFPYPISLTLWHMFFCSTVGFLCVRVFKVGRLARLRPRPSRSAQTPDSSPPLSLVPQSSSPRTTCPWRTTRQEWCPSACCTRSACGCRTRRTCTCRCPSSR